jgi:hypothetical protein
MYVLLFFCFWNTMDSESTAMPKMAKALMVGREYRIGMERGREEGVGGKE